MAATYKTEFRRSIQVPLVAVIGAALGFLSAAQLLSFLLIAAAVAIGIADVLWQRRHPVIVFHENAMVIHPGMLRRSIQLSYAEVLGWAHSKRWVGFETIQSKRVYLALQEVRKLDRPRLLRHIGALKLGQSASSSISSLELERREWRLFAAVFAIAAVLLFALSRWGCSRFS